MKNQVGSDLQLVSSRLSSKVCIYWHGFNLMRSAFPEIQDLTHTSPGTFASVIGPAFSDSAQSGLPLLRVLLA